MTRESNLSKAFVELADTLVDDFDVVDFLTVLADRCVSLFGVDAAGLVLVQPQGGLQVVASSSEEMHLLEVFGIQTDEGPCLDCYRTGEPVLNVDLDAAEDRWPRFTPAARAAGFHSVNAVPMRCRGRILGALNMFRVGNGILTAEDVSAAQALADVSTIGILQHQAVSDAQLVTQQLQQALNSRIVIEQAKGVLAERAAINMDEAFSRLRAYARNRNQLLSDVARQMVEGSLSAHALHPSARAERP